MQITVLNKGNVPIGPFTRAQIAEKLQAGEISLDSLAFVEGLSQWTPLRDVLAKVDASLPPTPPLVATPPVINAPLATPSLTAPPNYSYAATMQPPPHLVYAGFWLRFVAYLLDSLIVSSIAFVAAFIIAFIFILIGTLLRATLSPGAPRNTDSDNSVIVILVVILEFIIWGGALIFTWLYFAKLESGPKQATYGKQILGLRVTGLSGERITFGRATGRFFGKIISGLTFYVGFIMAGFTDRKQALHDMIAGTLVVKQ